MTCLEMKMAIGGSEDRGRRLEGRGVRGGSRTAHGRRGHTLPWDEGPAGKELVVFRAMKYAQWEEGDAGGELGAPSLQSTRIR